jgi:hypothetical protein
MLHISSTKFCYNIENNGKKIPIIFFLQVLLMQQNSICIEIMLPENVSVATSTKLARGIINPQMQNICTKCAVQQWLAQHPECTQSEDSLLAEISAALKNALPAYTPPLHQLIRKNVCIKHHG